MSSYYANGGYVVKQKSKTDTAESVKTTIKVVKNLQKLKYRVRQEDLVLLKSGVDFKASAMKGRDFVGRPELSSQQLSAIAKKKGYHGCSWSSSYNQKTGEQMVMFYKTKSAGGVKGSKAKYNRFWNK